MEPALLKFVEFLQRNRIRATYTALADAVDVPPRSLGRLLGERCPLASWIVNASTGKPTGYQVGEMHQELFTNPEVIATGEDLVRRMRRESR